MLSHTPTDTYVSKISLRRVMHFIRRTNLSYLLLGVLTLIRIVSFQVRALESAKFVVKAPN